MKIGIIGHGAIAHYVEQQLTLRNIVPCTYLLRNPLGDGDVSGGCSQVTSAEDLPDDLDLMVDCAGHAGLAAHGPTILRRGIDLLTVSIGALAHQDLFNQLEAAAEEGNAKLIFADGAIGALDCLRSARIGGLDNVTYIGRKPPAGWIGSPAEDVLDLDGLGMNAATHFEGTAREVALKYPKNANVAAAVALAGAGFDATRVKLIADPNIHHNIHEIIAEGTFGKFMFHIEAASLPDNPRSSALAAMSVISKIEQGRGRFRF